MRQQKGHHRHAAAPRRCSCCAAGQSHHRRRAASSTLRAGQVAWQCAALAALVATACARQLLAAAARDPGGLAPHGLAHGIRLRSSTGSTQPSSAASASAASVSGLGALDVDDLGGEQEAAEPWWDSSAGAPGGGRALAEAMPPGPPCPSLSKELLYRLAKQNTVLVMCIDRLLLRRFARSWVRNVQRANITYWVVAAMDPWSSKALGTMGVRQCFNSPPPKNATVNFHSDGQEPYAWGNDRWHKTTWRKVHAVRSVYALGFNVIHSDADSTWWSDPLPWFTTNVIEKPQHLVLTTDSLDTKNDAWDKGLEVSTTPFFNINTGVYFIKQYPEGNAFFDVWLSWEHTNIGHDQDGLNTVVRGRYFRGDQSLPEANWDTVARVLYAALHNVTQVGLLPIHFFGNAYTYNIGRAHLQLNATLLCTHWVWTGGSPESKIQHIRDAMRYADSPSWYGLPPAKDEYLYEYARKRRRPQAAPQHAHQLQAPGDPSGGGGGGPLMLLSMGLTVPSPDEVPANYNHIPMHRTEEMVQFHTATATSQLRQAYWGILASAALERTFILPAFHCYCAKNWYMTQSCRINGEHHTRFPFHCSLSDLFRAKRVLGGIVTQLGADRALRVNVRERRFLEHDEVPPEIKESKLVLEPAPQPSASVPDEAIKGLRPEKRADGSHALVAPWPMNTEQLRLLINTADGGPWRHVHLANATQLVGRGFADASVWAAFDANIVKYKAYWCCRSPADMTKLNATDRVELEILPADRKLLQPKLLRLKR